MRRSVLGAGVASVLTIVLLAGASPAGADPALTGEGYAFGGTVTLAGTDVLPPTPESSASLTGSDSDSDTLIEVPAGPLLVDGTLISSVTVHEDADVVSELTHSVPGPYNAQALGQVESLDVLLDVPEAGIPLVGADLITGEVVAKCVGDTVEYSATSDDVDLAVAGEGALGDLTEEILDTLFPGLDPVDPIVNVEQDVQTPLPDGLAVDALVVTVLEAADPTAGLVQVRLGHAELSGVTCGDPGGGGGTPECSDGVDNDDDGVADEDDPGCHTDGDADNPDSYNPNDDDESDDGGGPPACSDGVDNDDDGVADEDDPGCHTDGDADNPDSYDPNDDDEGPQCSDGVDNDGDGTTDLADPGCTDAADETEAPDPAARALPNTGGPVPVGIAGALGAAALALLALRRVT
jgi:hypothetical protein